MAYVKIGEINKVSNFFWEITFFRLNSILIENYKTKYILYVTYVMSHTVCDGMWHTVCDIRYFTYGSDSITLFFSLYSESLDFELLAAVCLSNIPLNLQCDKSKNWIVLIVQNFELNAETDVRDKFKFFSFVNLTISSGTVFNFYWFI